MATLVKDITILEYNSTSIELYTKLKQYKKVKSELEAKKSELDDVYSELQNILNNYTNNTCYKLLDIEFNNIVASKGTKTDNKALEDFLSQHGKSIDDFKIKLEGFKKAVLDIK